MTEYSWNSKGYIYFLWHWSIFCFSITFKQFPVTMFVSLSRAKRNPVFQELNYLYTQSIIKLFSQYFGKNDSYLCCRNLTSYVIHWPKINRVTIRQNFIHLCIQVYDSVWNYHLNLFLPLRHIMISIRYVENFFINIIYSILLCFNDIFFKRNGLKINETSHLCGYLLNYVCGWKRKPFL